MGNNESNNQRYPGRSPDMPLVYSCVLALHSCWVLMRAKCLNPRWFVVDLPGMALTQYQTGRTRRWLCRAGQDARAGQRLVTFGTSISQIMKSDLLDSPPSLEFWWFTVFLMAQPLSTKSVLFTSEPTRYAHMSAFRQPTQSSYQTQGHENTSFHREITCIQLECSCIRFSSISERVKSHHP